MSGAPWHVKLTWKMALLAAICCIIGGAIPATLVTLYLGNEVETNSGKIEANAGKIVTNAATTDNIIGVLEAQCERDHKFRIQYRVRGQAEQKLLGLFVKLAAVQVRGVADPPPTSQQVRDAKNFLTEFKPLLAKIHILPVPDCQQQAKHLRRDL